MTRFRDLADVLDTGPDISDPPQEHWRLLEELEAAAFALAQRIRDEPGIKRAAAQLFCKTETNIPGIFFRVIWSRARSLAGLAEHAKGGRPPGSRTKKLTGRPIS